MTPSPRTEEELRKIRRAFAMPSVQTMMSRKSSITNAFVNSLIPVIVPSIEEIEQALAILGMTHDDVRCAYCGVANTEWDHLRPLVLNRRPTGYVSEIGNLVPACGKCNQSKGNKYWLTWMTSAARLSPAARGVADIDRKIERLRAYERWRPTRPIDFERIIGSAAYTAYWQKLDAVIDLMADAQGVADGLRKTIALMSGHRDEREQVEQEVTADNSTNEVV